MKTLETVKSRLKYLGVSCGILFLTHAAPVNAAQRSTAATKTSSDYSNRATSPVDLDITGGLVTTNGSYGGVFLLGVGLPVANHSPVRLGLSSGVLFVKSTWLPILVSVLYHFNQDQAVSPYIGGAVGPLIRVSTGTVTIGGVTVSTSTTGTDSVLLGILIRPGVRIGLTEKLDANIEVPLGGLTGTFYIAPTAGLSLHL